MSLRALAERLSRGRVLKRRLPAAFGGGRLYVSPEGGGLKYWKRDLSKLDPDLLALVDDFVKPGDSVWDFGANMGLLTFAAANRAGPEGYVLSVDADINNVMLLLKTRSDLDSKRNAPVDVLPVAVGRPGKRFAQFAIAARARASNALVGHGSGQMGGVRETRSVPMVTADELLEMFRPPKLLKIDVEGAEMEVLQAAERMLGEVRPVIYVEVGSKNQESFAALVRRHRYRMFDGAAASKKRTELDLPGFNCLAIPG